MVHRSVTAIRGVSLGFMVLAITLLTAWPVVGANDPVVAAYRQLFEQVADGGKLPNRSQWPNNDLLASYLDLELLLAPGRPTPSVEMIRAWLNRWPDHPQTARVMTLMDTRMAEAGDDATTLAWFDQRPPPRNNMIRIRYIQLLLQKKRMVEAEALWKPLYRSNVTIPPQLQNGVQQAGFLLTGEDHEARARALLMAGKSTEFKKVLPLLSPTRQLYFRTLAAALAGDDQFNGLIASLGKPEDTSPELWKERIDWLRAHGESEHAQALLLGKEGSYLNPEDRQLLRYRLARVLFYQEKDPLNAYKVLKDNLAEAGGKLGDSLWLYGWSAIHLGNRAEALEQFKRLAMEADSAELRSQGGYWAAKLTAESGADGSPWMEVAAHFPETFYGLLAAEERQRPLPPDEPHVCILDATQPAVREGINRLQILQSVGLNSYLAGEIQFLVDKNGFSLRDQLCLANRFGILDLAMRMAKELRTEGILSWTGLFPIPANWSPALGWQLDSALIWGVAKQESLFHPNAVSSVGARGLLQLMPATAEGEAKLLHLPPPSSSRLEQPSYNLSLGQSYLQRMISSFKGDLAMAVAAYNAGPGRVAQWKAARSAKDGVTFIEEIPITETRIYVKKVLHGFAAYRLRMNGESALTKMIEPGQPGLQYVLAANQPWLKAERKLIPALASQPD